jgi:hypothetical protein
VPLDTLKPVGIGCGKYVVNSGCTSGALLGPLAAVFDEPLLCEASENPAKAKSAATPITISALSRREILRFSFTDFGTSCRATGRKSSSTEK